MKKIVVDKKTGFAGTWSASSLGSAADTSPMELAALGEHLRRCVSQRGALFPLKSAAETLNRLAGPRVVTIIVLFALVSILASVIL